MLSPNFFIKDIRIGTVENASCVNIGNNAPNGFESFQKLNQGFGNVHGDGNSLEDLRSVLSDSAILDMLVNPKEGDIPEWVVDLIKKQVEKDPQVLA
ncbi:hypothetical protein LCM20_17980 [Halobacillus litoralis]|uniref:hypothetical protein n=1 Tax=Halobacillus litoralis TaxID=45668 RepID=UPI001CD5F39B|nr:hypothetical protein [Halobacillus litoralis]MCA0972489.1 hypothetical protein [Halobacillus litoralis]